MHIAYVSTVYLCENTKKSADLVDRQTWQMREMVIVGPLCIMLFKHYLQLMDPSFFSQVQKVGVNCLPVSAWIRWQHAGVLLVLLTLLFHIDEKTINCYTPKFIIQPFVENAIFHGFEQSGKRNQLEIITRIENNELLIIIKDNGTGMKLSVIESIKNISA